MKNKTLMKTLSALLAVVMVLCSAPLSGFVGLEFPEIKLPKWTLYDFGIKADAATAYKSDIYTYSVSNGEATITDCDTSVTGEIIIPSSLDGYAVTSIGENAFLSCTGITSIIIPNSVVSIGGYAFFNCASVKSVIIPDTVTSIGERALGYCSSLNSLIIGNGVKEMGWQMLEECKNLTSIVIGSGLSHISKDSFRWCKDLKIVAYVGTVEQWDNITIDDYNSNLLAADRYYNCVIDDSFVFSKEDNCASLLLYIGSSDFVTIPETINGKKVTEIISGAFDETAVYDNQNNWENGCLYIGDFLYCVNVDVSGAFTVKDGTRYICGKVFENCKDLTTVFVPASIEGIGENAFYGCDGLARIYFLGDMADWCNIDFNDEYSNPLCYSGYLYINTTLVSDIVIPDAFTEIKPYTFYNYKKISSITIPKTVTKISENAFYGCDEISTVYFNGDVTKWCEIKFENEYSQPVRYGSELYIDGEKLVDLIVPANIKRIGNYQFYGCKSIESLIVEEHVEKIGCYAFSDCNSLTSVTFTIGITVIEEYAFRNCKNLTTLIIPGSVGTISCGAFYYCNKLSNVAIGSGTVMIEENAFYFCTRLVSIAVPKTITTVGENAFKYCYDLEKVYYDGSHTEWVNMAIYSGNDYFIDAHVEVDHIHDYSSLVIEEPSCLTNGKKNYKCSCGYNYTEIIPAIGHTEVIDEAVDPTCTKIGLTEGSHCLVCGEVFVAQKVIEFYGHTESDAVEENRKESTCTGKGSYDSVIYCSVCDEELSRETIEIAKKGHVESEEREENRVDPGCTIKGSYDLVVYCSICNEELSRETVVLPALGHGEKIVVSETPPTCTEKGMRVYKCSVCGYVGEVVFLETECPQSSHNYPNNANITENFSSFGAVKLILKFSSQTQVESGYDYIYIYNGDGSLYGKYTGTSLKGKTIELEGDRFSIKLTSDSSATYYGYSFDSITAITPNEEYREEIPATGHDYGSWNITTEPTMTDDGIKTRTCSFCGEKETDKLPKTGITITLTDSEGKVVNETVVEGDVTEYTFETVEDGEYIVTVSKETYVSREYTVTTTDGEVRVEYELNHVGDINGDGKVTVLDYTQLLRHVKKTSALGGYTFDCADVNGDGKLSVLDYTKLLRHVKKIEMLW